MYIEQPLSTVSRSAIMHNSAVIVIDDMIVFGINNMALHVFTLLIVQCYVSRSRKLYTIVDSGLVRLPT
jgi:hypothetical protein